MTKHLYRNRHKPFRLLRLERLEERQMLSVSADILQNIRDAYTDFDIASDVNIIDIEAEELSVSKLKSAIETTAETMADDLIILFTTADAHAIEFSLLTDELIINASPDTSGAITIVAYGDEALTIDANSYSRILTVQAGVVQLGNLVFTGGYTTTDLAGRESSCALGGGIANAGKLTLDGVTVTNCAAKGVFNDLNFGFCSKGGGIYNAGILLLVNSTISGNTAHSGAANSYEAAAFGAGGGIFNDASAVVTVRSATLCGNTAESETLIVPLGKNGEQTVQVEQFGLGGGLYNLGFSAISENSAFSNNFACQGGAAFTLGETETSPASLLIEQTELKNNTAKEFGGAVFSGSCCITTLTGSLVEGNAAGQYGGGIYNESTLSISNSVLSGNTADNSGGAIYTAAFGKNAYDILLTNVTIAGNSAGIKNSGFGGASRCSMAARHNRF